MSGTYGDRMKKYCLIFLMFVVSCMTIIEINDFEMLNKKQGYFLPNSRAQVNSCKELKKNSYDTFYTPENQKCISEYSDKILETSQQVVKAESNAKKITLIEETLTYYEKFDNCKVTQELSVNDIGKEYGSWRLNYRTNKGIITYFEAAYNICKDSEIFPLDATEAIIKEYKSLAVQKEEYYKQKEKIIELGRTLYQQKQISDKMKTLLSEIASNPVLRQMRQVAPDFMNSEINDCPLIFMVQALKDFESAFDSDLRSPSNYKFIKNGTSVLTIKAGTKEFTFEKRGNNKVDVTVYKYDDYWGYQKTSKNVIINNLNALSLCNSYKNSDEVIR